ncbi:CD82 antigen [Kryptolebias marmoratus]|uniref:Tetraspanin n=1 Tax=Kryptolebias marmoratus TaxID=37003 RepID=A0A3Q3AM41_KRYMA|nr:CD82 antigen [Kryptolebias marmoratus]
MGKGCIKISKYFLFLFNVIIFKFGTALLGFGLWLLLDNQSFIAVLTDSTHVKVACYILIAVGSFSMLLGFFGCLGAIYEIRCLLGLYFTCLLLVLLAQITAGALIYFKKDKVRDGMFGIVKTLFDNYPGNYSSTEQAWDFIQKNMKCCGWYNHQDWRDNVVIMNSNQVQQPCSCLNTSLSSSIDPDNLFCETSGPSNSSVYDEGCASEVEKWFNTNIGVVLGIYIAVALIELLGMIVSICLCRNITTQTYTEVPKY